METLPKLTQQLFPTSTVSFDDFLVKLFQSLENEKVLTIPDERFSLSLREYCEQNNLDYSFSKMWSDCFLTTVEKLSESSSLRLQNWGMICNGKCITAKITESHRIGSECTLSDILEEKVDLKYFLSDETMKKIFDLEEIEKSKSEHSERIRIDSDSEKWKNESAQQSLQEQERIEADNLWSESEKQQNNDSATQGGGIQ